MLFRSQEITNHQETLHRNFNQLIEIQQVLKYGETARAQKVEDADDSFLTEESLIKFGSVSGVVLRERFPAFERLLFRATRGNLFLRNEEIKSKLKDPHTGKMEEKNVFIIFY